MCFRIKESVFETNKQDDALYGLQQQMVTPVMVVDGERRTNFKRVVDHSSVAVKVIIQTPLRMGGDEFYWWINPARGTRIYCRSCL